jgi:hypothetical protein
MAPGVGARAQQPRPTDSVTVIPGAQYEAGLLHRLLLGSDYRSLWTTPLRVEVLDLGSFAGGITPLRRGGGMQTRSLRFRAADGREFAFRSVDKDPSAIIPADLRETFVDRIVQDQISSAHPVGTLSVAPILDAVGVLHADPRLVVLPDDARLGEFRQEFGGLLGFIEERPDDSDDALASFAGASLVVSTDRLLERIEEDLERVDARAFLAARLTDLFLGDWDRHSDQWRWARFGNGRDDTWKPIPRDRDQVFSRMDGLLLALARQYYPQLVVYGEDYPDLVGLTWNARALDRRLLVGLERPVWDSVAAELQSRLNDRVLAAAVASMPEELRRIDGDRLARRLTRRRDGLPDVARRFYELLATEVEVHTTDAPERVQISRLPDGATQVVAVATDQRFGTAEVYRRVFHPDETDEVRLFLHGGGDTVHVSGPHSPITIRVLGGAGTDVFVDESGGTRFYDTGDDDVFVLGAGTTVDRRGYDDPAPSASTLVRDWGSAYRFPLWGGFSPDVGVLAGLSIERYDFGFRKQPWAWSLKLRGAWATLASTYRAEAELRIYRENSAAHVLATARASGLDIIRFHGLGNETELTRPARDYRVEHLDYDVDPRVVLPMGDALRLSLGPTLRYARTRSAPDWLLEGSLPYGMGAYGQMGLGLELTLDGRDRTRASTSGAALTLVGRTYPAIWDVEEAFGYVAGTASLFVSPWQPMKPTLALRGGAKKVFGTYPFHEAAYLGGPETVRLGIEQRFGGDAYVHGNAEIRVALGRATLVLPADVGVSGLYDVGRVWLQGEESTRWHDVVGGGLWVAFLRPENVLSVAVAKSDERTSLYLTLGFAY